MSEPVIQDFPFERCPQYSSDQIDLVTKLTQSLNFLSNQSQVIPQIQKHLIGLLKQPIEVQVQDLKSIAFDDFSDELTKTSVSLILQKQPESVPALLTFDSLLAKVLVKIVVSQKLPDINKHAELSVQPVTYLEYGVLEYVFVRLMCALQNEESQNFSGWLYNEVKTGKSFLGGVFSHQDELVSLKLSLKIDKLKPFYIQIVLPLKIVTKCFQWPQVQSVASERLKQFRSELLPVQLQVGQVTLTPSDINQLDVGDILLLDQCELNKNNQNWTGPAQVVFTDKNLQNYGYDVELEPHSEEWNGKVVSSLSVRNKYE